MSNKTINEIRRELYSLKKKIESLIQMIEDLIVKEWK